MYFLYFYFAFMLINVCSGVNKYTEQDNVQEDDRKFKMGKINTLWQKAQKLLRGQQLADLHADLTLQDRKEKALKHAKMEGTDQDGLLEAGVRREYLDIIHKYDLGEYFPDDIPHDYESPPQGHGGKSPADVELRDDRLKKLWKTAKSVGFTDEEMATLLEEFSHHQMKLDELHTLKQEFADLEDQVDNSIESLDGQDTVWRDLQKRRLEMKHKHKRLADEYRTLESKTLEETGIQPLFRDDRVLRLWSLAKKTNMSMDELDSFRKELKHFDHRLEKHEYLQEELKKSADKLSTGPHHKEDHEDLEGRVKQYGSKVDKYHKDLKQTIERRLKHTEL